MVRFLILEDVPADAELMEYQLKQAGYEFESIRVENEAGFVAALETFQPDVILADQHLPAFDGLTALKITRATHPDIPFVFVTGTMGEQKAVETMVQGAAGYVLKDNIARLPTVVKRVLETGVELRKRKAAEEALRASEARYRSLFENMLEGYARCRMTYAAGRAVDFVFIDVNPAFEALIGFREAQGKAAGDLIPGLHNDNPELLEHYGRVTESGRAERFETYLPSLGIWISSAAYCTSPGEFVAVFDNITEEKKAALALRVSEERFQLAMRGATDGLWDWNVVTDSVYYSPHWNAMLGYADGEIGPTLDGWKSLIHPDDVQNATLLIQDLFERRTDKYEIEFRMRHKDGHYVDILARAFPVRDARGNLVRLVGTHVDISEKKRAEQALREAKERTESILESVADVHYLLDKDWRYVYANRAAVNAIEKAGGRQVLDVLGRTLWETLPDIAGTELEKQYRRTMEQRVPLTVESHFARSDTWWENRLFPVPEGLAVFASDISERKRSEASLVRTIQAIADSIEMRDPTAKGHDHRLSSLAGAIALEMGLSEHMVQGIQLASIVHDLGKINIPADILNKPSSLSPEEFKLIQTHCQTGYDILKGIDFPWPIAQIVFQHHERLDGTGYPQGLKGDAILLEARIVAVADIVEAMTSPRPYRPTPGLENALLEIDSGRGTAYDAAVVEACTKLFRQRGFNFSQVV